MVAHASHHRAGDAEKRAIGPDGEMIAPVPGHAAAEERGTIFHAGRASAGHSFEPALGDAAVEQRVPGIDLQKPEQRPQRCRGIATQILIADDQATIGAAGAETQPDLHVGGPDAGDMLRKSREGFVPPQQLLRIGALIVEPGGDRAVASIAHDLHELRARKHRFELHEVQQIIWRLFADHAFALNIVVPT